jgi:hypothetical protein
VIRRVSDANSQGAHVDAQDCRTLRGASTVKVTKGKCTGGNCHQLEEAAGRLD